MSRFTPETLPSLPHGGGERDCHLLPFTVTPFEDRYLLVNEVGQFAFLSSEDFSALIQHELTPQSDLYQQLLAKNFIRTVESEERLIQLYARTNAFMRRSTALFIVIPTLRCDHHCLYCHASHKAESAAGYDMTMETAQRTIDFILSAPGHNITVEFQGGESLLNFDIVKTIYEGLSERNQGRKDITFSMVTNLYSADEQVLDYLVAHNIQICSSLDGPEQLHTLNRGSCTPDSYERAIHNFKGIRERQQNGMAGHYFSKPNLLLTVSRHSFAYPKEIIDTYRALDQHLIAIRPLNPFGYANAADSAAISYDADEFLAFYEQVMDHIIEVNKGGELFIEQISAIMLSKILLQESTNYLDIRSPCGAGIGQVAIDYDGKIYTCDEGRMLAQMGNETFCIGQVGESSFAEMVRHEAVQACCVASCLEANPGCEHCGYKPYCGQCPVYNYQQQGDLFGSMPTNQRCKIQKGVLDYLFRKIKNDPEAVQVFERWVTNRDFVTFYLGNRT